MYTNPSFTHFIPKAKSTQITVGCATDWYDHETADAILCEALGKPGPYEGRETMYVNGWFAEYGWYDEYADYRSNSWVGSIVGGPFFTKEEAYAYAENWIAENYPDNG